jgi:hypothetical protein
MKQNFVKTIQGHQLEFSKQVHSACYNVSPTNVEYKGILSLKKDEKGMWNVSGTDKLPAWFNEISMYVHNAIEENETREKKEPHFLQFAYPF